MIAEFRNIIRDFGLAFFKRYYSIYAGEVVENEDPAFRGRVKIKCAAIFGDQTFNGWVPGRGSGLFAIPDKGDAVWVTFLEGDPRFPIWEHGYYGDNDVPSYAKNNDNKPTNRYFQTPYGQRIELDYKEGDEKVRVHNSDTSYIEINSNGISIVDGNGVFLGSLNTAAEPSVLGNKNEAALNKIKDSLDLVKTQLQTIGSTDGAIATPMGLSYAASFVSLSTSLGLLIGQLTTLIEQTKSTKVKLD